MTIIARSILGVQFSRDTLFKRKLFKTYEHAFSEDVRFHPQNGSKLWREGFVGKLSWMEDEGDDFNYNGLSFIFSDCRNFVYAGLVLGEVNGNRGNRFRNSFIDQARIDHIQTLINQELLFPLGLPDTKVEAWTVLYCS
jgi:hypothetical protein